MTNVKIRKSIVNPLQEGEIIKALPHNWDKAFCDRINLIAVILVQDFFTCIIDFLSSVANGQ